MTTPLFVSHVTHDGASPTQWMLFTHGIYGAGNNWRAIARRVVAALPSWGALLVDLRNHGRSPVGEPPHTVAACADDLIACMQAEASAGRPVRALSGHSFGGKVVLLARAGAPWLGTTWVHDASLASRPSMWQSARTVVAVLDWLSSKSSWPTREAFVAEGAPFGTDVASWLALNLEPRGDGFGLRFDVNVTRELLQSYFTTDGTPWLAGPGELHVIVGTRTDTVSADEQVRLRGAGALVHPLDAAHWVHVDQPDQVVELMVANLRALPTDT